MQITQNAKANVFIACISEYTKDTGSEALPLGSYFQDHVRSFIQPQKRSIEKQYAFFGSVIHQLR